MSDPFGAQGVALHFIIDEIIGRASLRIFNVLSICLLRLVALRPSFTNDDKSSTTTAAWEQ